eukprot:TRINITY_DN26455_c0_g1_i1.p1 TRINITY_DN26455_c0_g1~~TRINITY_DN26455_c0_g1_i1.p1  ORF type:complete len:730 (-),score=174.00 TRINITY_DN26455_c0_g1_i1:261-2450(-)
MLRSLVGSEMCIRDSQWSYEPPNWNQPDQGGWPQPEDEDEHPLNVDDFYDMRDLAEDLQRQLHTEGTQRVAAEEEADQLRCEKGHLSLRMTSAESCVKRLESQLSVEIAARKQAEAALEDQNSQLQDNSEALKVTSLETEISDLQDKLEEDQARSSALTLTNEDLTQQLEDSHKAQEAAEAKVGSLQEQLASLADQPVGSDDTVVALQDELKQEKRSAAQLQKKFTQLEKTHEDVHNESRSLQLQLRELREENNRLSAHRSDAQKLSQLAEELGELPSVSPAEVMVLQEENRELQASVESLKKQLQEEKQDAHRLSETVKKHAEVAKSMAQISQSLDTSKTKLTQLGVKSSPSPAASLTPKAATSKSPAVFLAPRTPGSTTPKVAVPSSPSSPWITIASDLEVVAASTEEPENIVIKNSGDADIDLDGYTVVDHVGKVAKSNRFTLMPTKQNPGPFLLGAGESAVFWFSAPRTAGFDVTTKTNPHHLFATYMNGSANKDPMMTDRSDTVVLKDSKGRVVSEIIPGTCSHKTHAAAMQQVGASMNRPRPAAPTREEAAPNKKFTPKKAAVAVPVLAITSVSAKDPEHIVIENHGAGEVDLEGYTIVDTVGKSTKANRFVLTPGKFNPGPFVLGAGESMQFWFSTLRTPGFDLKGKTNPHHAFGTTKSGSLRKAAVINDEGDTLALQDPEGTVIAQIVATAAAFEGEEKRAATGKRGRGKETAPKRTKRAR